jgi:hypothetical protein
MENSQHHSPQKTVWYHYLLAFFAGVFAINILPHYINGIMGQSFPTPFADPPGKGLSSPVINVLWALINFVISFSILYFAKIGQRKKWVWIAFFIGAVLMSFNLASYFGALHLEH